MANPSSALSMNKRSLSMSKTKPKIRIIHIYAPEIIKTDVENFQDLVRILTGKSSGNNAKKILRQIKKSGMVYTGRNGHDHQITGSQEYTYEKKSGSSSRIMMPSASLLESRGSMMGTGVKRDELGMWNAEGSGGFLKGFEHLDGYVDQDPVEFPFLSSMDQTVNSTPSSSSQSHAFIKL